MRAASLPSRLRPGRFGRMRSAGIGGQLETFTPRRSRTCTAAWEAPCTSSASSTRRHGILSPGFGDQSQSWQRCIPTSPSCCSLLGDYAQGWRGEYEWRLGIAGNISSSSRISGSRHGMALIQPPENAADSCRAGFRRCDSVHPLCAAARAARRDRHHRHQPAGTEAPVVAGAGREQVFRTGRGSSATVLISTAR